MKIAIISDLHLGYDRFKDDAYTQAKSAMIKAADMADAIIIPGDVFDKRIPNPEILSQALKIFREIHEKKWEAKAFLYSEDRKTFTNIPVIAISGTHERIAIGKDNALKLLDLAGFLIDTSETTTIISKGDEKVAVFGLGGISEEIVADKIKELNPPIIPNAFNIFMFHQSVYEVLPFNNRFMKLSDFPKGFDLYVDGHIHCMIDMSVYQKKFLIPGSTVLTQLKDSEQEDKGFILFDTLKYEYEFIKINSRKFTSKTINLNEAGREEITEKCINLIESNIKNSEEKPIIRIKLEGTVGFGVSNSRLNLKTLTSTYNDKAFIEIDYHNLSNPELQETINSLRDNKIGDMSIKERGIQILNSQLFQTKFDLKINISEFMDLLITGPMKKNKLIEEALTILDQ